MADYQRHAKRRRAKQILMAVLFLAILAGGWRWHLLGYFIPLCMVIGIAVGFGRGRAWCDWACPRGSFYDTIVKSASPQKKIPPFIKRMPFRIGILSVLMSIMTVMLVQRWPDLDRMGKAFVTLLTTTTALGVILALIFHQRTWCYICPIGTIVNLIGTRRKSMTIDSARCTECGLCAKVCPMQISPLRYKGEGKRIVKDRDCLQCGLCVSACPGNALGFVSSLRDRAGGGQASPC